MKKLLYFLSISFVCLACHQSVETVTLHSTEISIGVGLSDTLHASLTPSSISNDCIEWISSDSSIVQVHDSIIYARSIGSAFVYALADDKYDSCKIIVHERVTGLHIPRKKVKLRPGEQLNLNAQISPSSITNEILKWTSSDSSVAVVINGIVEGRNAGTAIVSVTADDLSSNCRVTVAELTQFATMVNKLGGSIMGDVRFTLVWNDQSEWNEDDLDAHCTTPNGFDIYYHDKIDYETKGWLDVDNTHPRYNITAVENITWDDKDTMVPGIYYFYVDRYANRGGRSGFRAEIEIDGHLYQYDYSGQFSNRSVTVACIRVDAHRNIAIKHILTPIN